MSSSQICLIDYRTGRLFPSAPEGTVLYSSASAGWRSITVESHRIPSTEFPEHYIKGHRLMVHIGAPTIFEWKQGNQWRQTQLQPGDFCLQSHGEINTPRWHNPLEILAIALEPEFVNQIFHDTKAPNQIAFQQQRGGFDPVIAQFATRMSQELESGYGDVLYGESMGLAFALHLLEHYGERTVKLTRPRGKLSSVQLRQVIDFIHDHLTGELNLVDLADQANLSAYHFARLFKQSIGLAPHQYVLQNRVERAKRLIKSSNLTLTDIGFQVGFYDQAHFSKAFKQLVGVSPKAFVKAINASIEEEFRSQNSGVRIN